MFIEILDFKMFFETQDLTSLYLQYNLRTNNISGNTLFLTLCSKELCLE